MNPGDERTFRTPDGTSVTRLELVSQALVAAVQAWTYPSDTQVRHAAVVACQQVGGMDYIGTVCAVMENMVPSAVPMEKAQTAARWAVVEFLLGEAAALCQGGLLPRYGIAQTGRPVDGLGNEIDHDHDQENGG